MDEASECNVRLFWKLIKRQVEILFAGDTFTYSSDIANAFAQHFKDVYNPKNNDSFNPISPNLLKHRTNP